MADKYQKQIEDQIKIVEEIIAQKKEHGKPTSFEEELVKSWKKWYKKVYGEECTT